ncbi:MAG: hypothetical protein WAL75_12000 [Terracidiphilus sp.]
MKIKSLYLVLAMTVAFASGAYTMAQVRDWHDVEKVHQHVIEAMHELEHMQQANGYNMGGHAARADQLLHQAERELDAAVHYAQTH